MSRARRPPRAACAAPLAALLTLAGGAPAAPGWVEIVDEAGVIHYTNEPCQPRYARYLPERCGIAPPPPEPATAPAGREAVAGGDPGLARAIAEVAARHGLDPRLVEAVVRVESAGDPGALSPRGAMGLMQLMPDRAARLGVQDPFDPWENLEAGARHLRDLLARYGGDLGLALAAYNAGEGAVAAWRGIPPFRETREYVQKVLSLYTPPTPHTGPPAAPGRLRPAGLRR